MKKTPLYDSHKKLNAKLVDFAGWEMPISYTSLKEEIAAVRNAVGVFDVSHMGEFIIEGEAACEFIDYLLPCDFQVETGKAVYSPMLNTQGKILDDLIAYKLSENKVMLCVNASNEEKDWNWVKSIHQSKKFNCTLSRESENFSLLALQGPHSEEVLKKYFKDINFDNFDYYSILESNDHIIARTGYTGEDGFEIFCKPDQVESMWNFFLESDVLPCGLGARDTLRLEVCYPLYGNELNENLTPSDCGIKWTVKSKVDYVGQSSFEAYQTKYKLVKLSLDKGIPRSGYHVLNKNNEIIGKITSGTMSPTLGRGIGLALVERAKSSDDNTYKIEIRNKVIEANYHKKPFYSGGHK